MKNLTIPNIAKACGGKIYNFKGDENATIKGVAIDSRKIEKDFMYIPFIGERVDGHSFINDVMEKGAMVSLSERELQGVDFQYILVDSTAKAIKDIAEFYRKTLDVKVVGITGSVGKTSTKEIIASVLAQKYKVLKTDGNFNNEIGLPLTVFRLDETDEIAVLEMGISEFEEMHRIAKVARPDVCVITNIGTCHLENLGDRDGVFKAKTEIFDYLREGGAIILNGDDDKLINVKEYKGTKPEFFFLDESQAEKLSVAKDAFAINYENLGLEGTNIVMNVKGEEIPAHIPIPGHHMISNALAAALVGKYFGLNKEEIIAGIESLKAVSGRNNIIKTENYTVIDDCYNANPVSMKASIDVLCNALGRKVAVLGDMFELGENEISMHKDIGQYAVDKKIDLLICTGKLSKNMYNTAKENAVNTEVAYFENLDELKNGIFDLIKQDDTILVKASNGMHFKDMVSLLTNFDK
jgi:UDP-N-acetylmuramoyl-tripeptide--D-alanyl-D-alanine ligase